MAKKIILLLSIICIVNRSNAQLRGGDNYYVQKWMVDINFPVGMSSQNLSYNFKPNYNDIAFKNISSLEFKNKIFYGIDIQGGYFIGRWRRFGIGTGLNYTTQICEAQLDKFRVDYKDYDWKKDVYRQVISAPNSVKENIKQNIINIPITLKYKQRFSTKIGITADLGILYNLSMSNKWSTDSKFNYEAIYQFTKDATGKYIAVYDYGTTPDIHDWLLTKEMYNRTISKGTVEQYFDSLNAYGYNVGLNLKARNKDGIINYNSGSIGFIFRPAVNLRIRKRFHANLGLYFSYQSFKKNALSNYKIIDKLGTEYTSMIKTISTNTITSIGINIGIRYFFCIPKDEDFDGYFDEFPLTK